MTDTAPDPTIIVAVFVFFGTVVASWLAARASIRVKTLEGRQTPYDALANRVLALEKSDAEKGAELSALRDQVGRLKRESREDRDYIARAARWIDHHQPGQYPPPTPPPWWGGRSTPTVPEGHA